MKMQKQMLWNHRLQLQRPSQLISLAMEILTVYKQPSIPSHKITINGFVSTLKPVYTSKKKKKKFLYIDKSSVSEILSFNVHACSEKVMIPREKPFIMLDGEGQATTLIQFNDFGNSITSSTFQLRAENFVARGITFKNTYNSVIPRRGDGSQITWAPAALIGADKAKFYQCSFMSLQDTLTDSIGRHYFESCYIEGAIDFIWGGGQSTYQGCTINATTAALHGITGFITAQARNSTVDSGGFVFNSCNVVGTGPVYLGRAYRKYSRVVFYKSYMYNSIVPEGWSPWTFSGQEDTIVYTEADCTGPGSDMSKRVRWLKNLPPWELHLLIDVATFLNQGGWMEKQPMPPI
ncbi:hypothetical protein JRO89_XS03G0318000 [Xanthoceras sorbifolium]|uniref:pectinesterase n=1 Tax=Xanthoceras sorbifolium TaxID=99658 RepID=A0ABQ8ID52_9ROSI|nr:hypothetical protein JRO89_XS03G0318000 [Xanthoceras sorbifolium]